jgi:class 3 adenylate cyclase
LVSADVAAAMQFPSICECQLRLKSYGGVREIVEETPRFSECHWYLEIPLLQSSKTVASGEKLFVPREFIKDGDGVGGIGTSATAASPRGHCLGVILVGYRKVIQPGADSLVNETKPWLPEEFDLLQSIASQVSLLVHSRGSDTLLSSMLPPQIAESLRKTGKAEAQQHVCTILFTDIVGFTNLSGSSEPEAVFDMLNHLYTRFDELVEQRGNEKLYKVETIGDAYMVVSGLPSPMAGDLHALEIAKLAMGLMREVKAVTITAKDGKKHPIKIRCGLHTGPVVAGVVGKVNPRYCLFGDTVNTASRMESNSESGRIHISDSTFKALTRLKESGEAGMSDFNMVARGGVEIKGKGNMETYWLE